MSICLLDTQLRISIKDQLVLDGGGGFSLAVSGKRDVKADFQKKIKNL